MNQYYLWFSVIVSFIALMHIPSKTDRFHNAGGSFVLALVLGWLLWPVFIFAAFKEKRKVNVRF